MLARQEVETYTPMIRRVYAIMDRKGMFREPPEELRGKSIAVRLSSQIARVQKIAEGNNIIRAVQAIGPIAAANPTVVDNFDADAIARYVVRNYGLPQDFLLDEGDRDQIRQQRANAEKAAAEAEQRNKMADTASKMGAAAQGFGQADQSMRGTA
jgi:hypothetical protein